MRVAFDLDNTLIPNRYPFLLEKDNWLSRMLGFERIRKGTPDLMAELKRDGWEVWIYTTSYRSHAYIRSLFWHYGVSINGIINQADHDKAMRKSAFRSSKYPPAFGIDVIIDDSEGVYVESLKYHFDMLLIKPEDRNWTDKVLDITKKCRTVPV